MMEKHDTVSLLEHMAAFVLGASVALFACVAPIALAYVLTLQGMDAFSAAIAALVISVFASVWLAIFS